MALMNNLTGMLEAATSLLSFAVLILRIYASDICENNVSQNVVEFPLSSLVWQLANDNSSVRIDAWIPSCVHSVLQRLGQIPDAYLRDNDVKLQWIVFQNWTYSVRFDPPHWLRCKEVVLLVARGVDTAGEVLLNGRLQGSCWNAHRRYIFILPKAEFRHSTSNEIAFRLKSPVLYAAKRATEYVSSRGYTVPPECPPAVQNGQCHVNFIRKAASSFSWDWGPGIPTLGISDDVTLIGFSGCLLLNLNVVPLRSNHSHWIINAEYELFCSKYQTAYFKLKIASLDEWSWTNTVAANSSLVTKTLLIPSTYVNLWWPLGYGQQILYNAKGTVSCEGGDVSTRTVRFGFRTVQLVEEPITKSINDGLTFYFKINGVPVFLKGANWVPPDALSDRVSRSRISYLLWSMRHSHMNTVRVWGGGSYESDHFYETADRLGIMVWQEFMFAVNLYPTDDEFLSNVREEVRYQMTRLKSHPAVITWSGNNENELGLVKHWFHGNGSASTYKNDYLILYNGTVADAVRQYNYDSTPFLLSSPSNGRQTIASGGISSNPNSNLYGDMHFYNYMNDAWNHATYPVARCVTEFGFQSLPSIETLLSAGFEEVDLNYNSAQLMHRQHHLFGHEEMLHQVLKHFQHPTNVSHSHGNSLSVLKQGMLNKWIYLTQLHQALAYKTAVEHFRRWRSSVNDKNEGYTMCALYWQLNDIWQAPSWSSIEYPTRWKMLHYYSRHFFSPVLVSPVIETNNLSVFVVSDLTHAIANASLIIKLHTWKTFKAIILRQVQLSKIRPLRSEMAYSIPLSSILGKFHDHTSDSFLHFVLEYNGKTLSSNFFLLGPIGKLSPEEFGQVKVDDVSAEDDNVFILYLICDKPSPFVWLDSGNISGHFSDNGFIMLQHMHKVKFTSISNVTVKAFTSSVSVFSLRNVYFDR